MTKKEQTKFIILRSFGNFLLLMSLYGVVATFGPAVAQEARFRIDQVKGISYIVKASPSDEPTTSVNQNPVIEKPKPDEPGLFSSLADSRKERVLIPKDPHFSILIPKIGASSKVIPNVDPNNEKEFKDALQHGIAHAKGTVFPGILGNTYLFAHSTDSWWNVGRYNAVFYLLKDVEVGDEVIIYFENRRYTYKVTEKLVADPQAVSLLVDSRGEEEKLILQTCWPPGTTWRRLFIVAKPT